MTYSSNSDVATCNRFPLLLQYYPAISRSDNKCVYSIKQTMADEAELVRLTRERRERQRRERDEEDKKERWIRRQQNRLEQAFRRDEEERKRRQEKERHREEQQR